MQVDAASGVAAREEIVEELFVNAVGLLNEVDRYNPNDVLPQILGRLNQWIALRKPIAGWQVDPLVAELPPDVRKLPSLENLAQFKFDREDGLTLQEAVWIRDVARAAVGRELDDLTRARLLFDWTIRNIQLEPVRSEESVAWPHRPWETLLFGRGEAVDRAWVWLLLARQQGLDAVLLAQAGPAAERGELPDAWLPAVLLEKVLYLFDPVYGLPIPSPGGQGVATLAQAVADERVFAEWKLDAEHPYRFKPDQFSRVVALVEASPLYLTERGRLMELDLAGDSRLVLSTDPSEVANRLKENPLIAGTRLWTLPYQRAARKQAADSRGRQASIRELSPFIDPPAKLWQARVLQLMGKYTGERNAIHEYQECRPAEAALHEARAQGKLSADAEQNLETAKRDASYWLGLVSFDRGLFEVAIDYFRERTLKATPDGPWTEGARYNLGRSYEALGQAAEARKAYEQTTGPQRPGNLLRRKS